MAGKAEAPTAAAAPKAAESPSEEGGAIQSAEKRAEAAERRAEAAESTLGKMEARLAAIEGRLQEAPAPEPTAGSPVAVPVPPEKRRRAFACPQHPNSEFLIQRGKVRQVRDPNSPTGYRDHDRDGDIKIKFTSGTWMGAEAGADEQTRIDDKVRIAWCEQHPEIARDVEEPMTPVWFEIKKGQIATSRSEPSFSPGIDVDAALAGDISKLTGAGGHVVHAAREQVAAANRGE